MSDEIRPPDLLEGEAQKIEAWLDRVIEPISMQIQSLSDLDKFRIKMYLLQARAEECRVLAGKFSIQRNPYISALGRYMIDRADSLEGYGLFLARKQDQQCSTEENSSPA